MLVSICALRHNRFRQGRTFLRTCIKLHLLAYRETARRLETKNRLFRSELQRAAHHLQACCLFQFGNLVISVLI